MVAALPTLSAPANLSLLVKPNSSRGRQHAREPRQRGAAARCAAPRRVFGDFREESPDGRQPLTALRRPGDEALAGRNSVSTSSALVADYGADYSLAPPSDAASEPKPATTPAPVDVLTEFEHKLEADVSTVGVTIMAILGVIIFWRGVWSLLDLLCGDSVFGDLCCVIVGLSIVLYIRLSGHRTASFWPGS